MRGRVGLVAIGVGVCLLTVSVGVGGAVRQALPRPAVCSELPIQLRSLCGGVGVTCSPLSDSHKRWEAVYATEPTRARAEVWARLARAKGLGPFHIEQDTHCSNGNGVYEVSQARFRSHAAAAALVRSLRKTGFPKARAEDS